MTVDRKHTEIFDQTDKMWAEGSSNYKNIKPKEIDIQNLLGHDGWLTDEIDIWFDDFQKCWRWCCKIIKTL